MNTLDIMVAGILILSFAIGFTKGFIKTVLGLGAFFAAAALSLALSPAVSDAVSEHTSLDESLSIKVQQLLSVDDLPLPAADSLEEQLSILGSVRLPEPLKERLLENNNTKVYELLDVDNLADYIGSYLAKTAINAMAYIAVFILALLAINVLAGILGFAARLPIIREINKLSGGIAGLILGLGFIWTFFAFSSFVISFQSMEPFTQMLEASAIAKHLYAFNPIMWHLHPGV